jgi:hypothetical protein
MKLVPNPLNLSVVANGRTYNGTLNVALNVPDFDAPILQANGWTFATGQNLSAGILYANAAAPDGGTGSHESPFNKLQDAINAAVASTVIHITGAFFENITMRDLDAISIVGDSEIDTSITNVGASHTFSWTPAATAVVNTFTIDRVEIYQTDTAGTYHAMHFDGNAVVYPNTFLHDEFDINFVDLTGAGSAGKTNAYFRNTGTIYWTHGQITGGDLTLLNASAFRMRQVEVGTLSAPCNLNATFDGNQPYCGLGRQDVTLSQQSIVYGNVILVGHPIYQEDTTCVVVGNITGTSLTSFNASGRDYCPMLLLYGQHGLLGGAGGNLTITFPDPQTAGASFNFLDMSRSHHLGTVTLTKTNFLPATARGYAIAYMAGDFDTTTASGLSLNGYVAADLRGGKFNQAMLVSTGAATVDRDTIRMTTATITASPTAITISPPLPSASYTVSVSTSVQLAAGVAIGSKTAGGFSLIGPISGTADLLVARI